MAPVTTSLAAVAIASMARGGALSSIIRGGAKALPPPPPSRKKAGNNGNAKGLYEAFMSTNDAVRFFLSGNCGNVVFFYTEKLIYSLLKQIDNLPVMVHDYMDSVSFFIAYVLQVVPQHWFHAFLVYGMDSIDTPTKYFRTLLGCYSAYMTSLVGSTLLNTFFVKILQIDKTIAFITTLWTFAIINYFFIGWIVRGVRAQAKEQPKMVADARKAAKDAQRAIAESRKKEQAKAKMVEAKMKAKADQARLKVKALEERAKAKDELDKQKAKEKALREKERLNKMTEKEKADARKKAKTKVNEVGNRQKTAAKQVIKSRGGGNRDVRFRACLDSKEILHSFVLSVGKGVNIDDE